MSALFSLLLLLLAVLGTVAAKFHVMKRSIPRETFVKLSESPSDHMHELVFAVQQKNLAEFDKMLLERSTPGSPLYQKWFTFDEVGQLTSNPDGANEVRNWLQSHGIEVTWASAHEDYLKASAPISKWEELLDTKFYHWEDHTRRTFNEDQRKIHRAETYSLPEEVKPHLSAVFNTVQVPPVFSPKFHRAGKALEEQKFKTTIEMKKVPKGLRGDRSKQTLATTGYVTVDFLNEYYEITTNDGSPTLSQSVFETAEEYFSPTDLEIFQRNFSLPIQPALAPYNFSTDNCIDNDCYEGNLDVQYIMGIAQQTATIYWYVTENSTTDPFVAWVTDISNTPNPPLANSVSWGSIEQANSPDTMEAFNTEAMKLTAMGVTITVSSGDNGAAENPELCNAPSGSALYDIGWTGPAWFGRGYFPSFPATSPYVTAVGATQGPEDGNPEIACQSQLGGVITTGGGFSVHYPTPSWQADAVFDYLNNLPEGQTPTNGFNPNGRAYPDVSMIGVWYQTVVQGEMISLFGTSASSPLFAALVTLTNTARLAQNKTAVGFLNPTLYALGSVNPYFKDVTEGHNKCTANGNVSEVVCCNSGFYASTGWDPLTGFGSVTLGNLQNLVDGAPLPSDDDSSDELSDGAIAGIVVGSVAGLALLGAGGFFLMSSLGASSAAAGSAAAGSTAAAGGATAGTATAVSNPIAAASGGAAT